MASQSQKDMFEDAEVDEVDPGNPREDENGDEHAANRLDGVIIEGPEPNDYNAKTRKTVLWKDGETLLIVDALDENLDLLIGHVKSHEYRRARRNKWQSLLAAVNGWNQDNETGVVRSVTSIRTRIHNLKTRTKAKLLKMRVHETGGGPAPRPLTNIEKAIERILGKTPEFVGVVQESGNSKIQMKQGIRHNQLQARICHADMVAETPNLVKLINTDTVINVNNMTANLKASQAGKVTSVKPTIRMQGDESPQLSQESGANEEVAPTGDLADLTASVTEAATGGAQGDAAVPSTNSSAKTYKGCGKGVGKGKSGSSGPPVKCRRATSTRPPPPDEESSDEDESNEIATQSIMVHSRRGYSTYPAYMFDIPPRKLKTDNLRKKLMISEIKNSKAQEEFYKCGLEMMGVMKEFFRMYAAVHNFPSTNGQEGNGEHGYAMPGEQAEGDPENNDEQADI